MISGRKDTSDPSTSVLVPSNNDTSIRLPKDVSINQTSSSQSPSTTNYSVSQSEHGRRRNDSSFSIVMQECDEGQTATQDFYLSHGQPLVRGYHVADTLTNSLNATHSFQNYSENDMSRSSKSEESDADVLQIIDQAAQLYHALAYELMITCLTNITITPHISSKYTMAVYFGLGMGYFKVSDYDLATSNFLKAQELAKEHNDSGTCSLIEYYLAEIEYSQNKFLSAASYYDKSISLHNDISIGKMFDIEPPSLSTLYCRQGTALRYGSKVMEAVRMYEKAVSHAFSKSDRLTAHTNLGNLYQAIGDYGRSVEMYDKTISLGRELQDYVSLGWAHGNIGNAYLGLSKREKALQHLRDALKLTLEFEPTPLAIGRALNNLGTAFQAVGNNEDAKEYYDQSLSQAVYGCDLPGQARVYGNLGNILMMEEKYSEAIAHYTETLSISRDRATQTTAYHNRGCARYERAECDRKKEPNELINISVVTYRGIDGDRHCVAPLPDHIHKRYRSAQSDLERVMKYHEQTLNNIKGSPTGLNLSVSLFETNSRTFQRLQDCCYCVDNWKQALVFAEQSRARTLGELLLKKKMDRLQTVYKTPLDLPQIVHIINTLKLPVVYMSFTGNRLLVWLLVAGSDDITLSDISISMYQVYLEQDQFDDKSFDFLVRYQLTEKLCNMVNMYDTCDYDSPTILNTLYEIIAVPLFQLFEDVLQSKNQPNEVILIPDSYTRLIPMSALQNPHTRVFLGDHMRFHIMNSLLTTGVLYQVQTATVTLPVDSKDCCVIGNPYTPPFLWKGEPWRLGRLPFSEEEAKRVAFTLGASPVIGYEASKEVAISKIKHSKIIHLATHGCASAGFLVFAGPFGSDIEDTDNQSLLLFSEDIEQITTPAALIVLSSCDSGRGMFKADGIQGIARSFLLAGAHTVLTSLWRVPDESACYFMHFFYRYLVDGFPSYTALQKACLSIRCYTKYGEFIHWSGYQLQGRDIKIVSKKNDDDVEIARMIGETSSFPDLECLSNISDSLLNGSGQAIAQLSLSPRNPIFHPAQKKDVQLLIGSSATCPMEIVIDYININHTYYTGGILWIPGHCDDLITAALEYINETTSTPLTKPTSVHESLKTLSDYFANLTKPVLLVLDHFQFIPTNIPPLKQLLNNRYVSIIITAPVSVELKYLTTVLHKQIGRGCVERQLLPLPFHQVMQRIVYFVLSKYDFQPMNTDQLILGNIENLLCGNSAISKLCLNLLERFIEQNDGSVEMGLASFNNEVIQPTVCHREGLLDRLDKRIDVAIRFESDPCIDESVQVTDSDVDDSTNILMSKIRTRSPDEFLSLPDPVVLIFGSQLISCVPCNPLERVLMYSLSILNSAPFHCAVLDCLEAIIKEYSPQIEYVNLGTVLIKYNVIVSYPPPVIKTQAGKTLNGKTHTYYIMPEAISEAIYLSLYPKDKIVACALMNKTINEIQLRRYDAATIEGLSVLGEDYSNYFDVLSLHAVGLKQLLLDYLIGEWSIFERNVIESVVKQYISDKMDTVGDYGVLELIKYFIKQ